MTKDLSHSDDPRYSGCDGSPKVVVWNITSRCNLDCLHCYFDATSKGTHPNWDVSPSDELNTKEGMDFIEDLASLGSPVLLFSGGEPLLRPDIFPLARFAKDKGLKVVLSTNGTLITDELAREIKKAHFSYVGISLDGTKRTNDSIRQRRGAFEAALGGIRNCQQAHLKVGLRFTLTKYNLQDLAALFDLVEREAIPRLCIYHLVYTGRGRALAQEDLTPLERRQAVELIWERTMALSRKGLGIEVLTVDNHADGVWLYLRMKRSDPQRAQGVLRLLETQGGNGSGVRLAALDDRGNVHPDQFWRNHPLGNIRAQRFSQIWRDSSNGLLGALRNRKGLLKGRCARCNFLAICNGNFRARAEAAFGDIWQEDPSCYLTEKEIKS